VHMERGLGVCMCCSSDTLTDVSSLHDVDDIDDDDVSQCRHAIASDDRRTSDVPADNLSDLTIPDFAVSSPLDCHVHLRCAFMRPYRSTMYVDAACCYRLRVAWSVTVVSL